MHHHSDHALLFDLAAGVRHALTPTQALAAPPDSSVLAIPEVVAVARMLICALRPVDFWHHQPAPGPDPGPGDSRAEDVNWDVYAVRLADRGCALRVCIFEYQGMPLMVLADLRALTEPVYLPAGTVFP